MTRPIVMDVIARDNASKTFKTVADSQTKLAKQTDATSKSMGNAGNASDNLRKSQLSLIAAQERYNKVAKDSKASVGQLASAQSSLIGAQQRVKKATDDAGKAAQGAARQHSEVAGKLKLAAAAAGALVAVKLVQFLKGAITAASDLNETQNKANVIFGKNAKAIDDWASTAATKLGLSRQAALDSAAGFGDMFKQLGFSGDAAATMSKQTVQLATDLGSFNNLPTAQVVEMISASFRGEYDSLQRVIPNISAARVQQEALNETHKSSVKDLTAAEKATATLTIIQRDGARAAGDFERTSGGMANQTKIATARFEDLKAKIGADLLPVVNNLLGFASGLLDVFTRYSDVLVPLVGVLGTFALGLWAVTKATKAWAEVQLLLNSRLVTRFAPGLIGMLGPLALAAGAFYVLYKGAGLLTQAISGSDEAMVKAAGRGAKDLGKALQDSGGAFDATAQKTLAATLVTGGYVDKAAKAHISVQQLTTGVTGNDEAFQSLVDTWKASGKPSDVTIGTLRRLHEQFQENTAAGQQTANTNKQIDATAQKLTTTLSTQEQALAQVRTATGDQNLTMADAAKKYTDAVTQAHSFTAELGYMQIALNNTSGKFITSRLGALALTDAIGTATDNWAASRAQVDAHGQSLKDNTADGRANEEWLLGQINAINQQALTYATSTGSIDKGTGSLKTNTDALRVAAEKAGFNKQEVQHMIDVYGTTPAEIKTSIEEQGSAAVLASLGDILNQLHAIADPVWGTQFRIANEENNPQLARLPGQARGGLMNGPGTSTSDSILARLSTGEYVVNAASTARHRALLENINADKFAFGGQVGRIPQVARIQQAAGLPADLLIDVTNVASLGQALGQSTLKGIRDAQAKAAAKAAADAARAGGIPGAPGSIPANVSAYQAYAGQLMAQMGMQSLGSLISLWNGESGWNPNALNQSSGAYGIPQALPADKMASAGADWHSNAQTQIRWGLGYIRDRYGSPDAAWSFWQSQSPHWYGRGLAPTVFSRPTLIGVGERGPETVSVSRGVGGAGVVVAPGAITVYAARGQDERAIAAQAFTMLRAWVAEEERKAAKGGRA